MVELEPSDLKITATLAWQDAGQVKLSYYFKLMQCFL